MNYGAPPMTLGMHDVECAELMFYQDMPIKLAGQTAFTMEPRLSPFNGLVGAAACDFIGVYGLNAFVARHVYISAKRLYQSPEGTFNRPGWHCDGFGTDDINYVWYDRTPTVFSVGAFDLPADDAQSMVEMDRQAKPENDREYTNGRLLRLDQFCVHRVGLPKAPEIRTFCKITVSAARFDLVGNSRNFLLDYNWPARPRSLARNTPAPLERAP